MGLRERIERLSIPEPNTGCWLWMGSINNKGYGMMSAVKAGRHTKLLAHRTSYESFVGNIPDGKWVLHKCDLPLCVNPRHLFLGNNADNIRDCMIKGRKPKGEKHAGAKLTDNSIGLIRSTNESSSELAVKFGVSGRHIRAIRRREAWKHV